ncbi:MAG: hypothetical protein QW835_00020 [Candidatus Hadarchaeum sp.]
MKQTWNTVLRIIKNRLGVPLNFLELSDEEIVEGLKTEVLYRFSNHVPWIKYLLLSEKDLLPTAMGQPIWRYRLPLDEDVVLDINDVYYTSSVVLFEEFTGLLTASYEGMIDLVLLNSFIDAVKSLNTRQTWQFFPPDVLVFDQEIKLATVEYSTVHRDLSTIRSDYFVEVFVDMCYAYVLQWILARRRKYSSLTTPFGNLELNVPQLEQEYASIMEKVETKLAAVPPDHLVYVVI